MLRAILHDLRSPLTADYAVIAAISGVRTSRILRLERNAAGKALTGPMTEVVFTDVLAALGWSLRPLSWYIPPISFKEFVGLHGYLLVKGPVIARMKNHMAVIEGRSFADRAHPMPLPLDDAPSGWRVVDAFSVHPVAADEGLLHRGS